MSIEAKVLDLFKVMVIDDAQRLSAEDYSSPILMINSCCVDFVPTNAQQAAIKDRFAPIDVKTLYSWDERVNGDFWTLVSKQLAHYYEVYGLNVPGAFDLEVTGDKIITMTYVKGVSEYELGNLVRSLIYSNAPIKDSVAVMEIIRHYNIPYSIELIKNNEIRVQLFDPTKDTFGNDSGDDLVRWFCYNATTKPLLIKSKQVIAEVKMSSVQPELLERHAVALAGVFNRHKPLILALKNSKTAGVINKISRLSKKFHRPLPRAVNKNFVADFLAGRCDETALNFCSVRDKLKFLYVYDEQIADLKHKSYNIRNGKVWTADGKQRDRSRLTAMGCAVLKSLANDLKHLAGKNILLDQAVEYGLPISRKQTIGNLPFGTQVSKLIPDGISCGIYWHNDGGASDLDLSTIDLSGTRTGWGGGRGYHATDIVFSGDITSAPSGAMEFMTSTDSDLSYGLFVNVFTGDTPCEMKLVVGTKTDDRWIGHTIINEPHKLESRGNLLGFVSNNVFTVYGGRLNSYAISSPRDSAIAEKAKVEYTTVFELLYSIGIETDLVRKRGVDYDYDLSYSGFTYDKLEALFGLN